MNNQVMQQSYKVIEQNNQLIQINNEQAAQINHLLEHLDLDGESESSVYLDGWDMRRALILKRVANNKKCVAIHDAETGEILADQ